MANTNKKKLAIKNCGKKNFVVLRCSVLSVLFVVVVVSHSRLPGLVNWIWLLSCLLMFFFLRKKVGYTEYKSTIFVVIFFNIIIAAMELQLRMAKKKEVKEKYRFISLFPSLFKKKHDIYNFKMKKKQNYKFIVSNMLFSFALFLFKV